jgi:2-oxoisovalerate dehydrogenase E1 component
MPRIINLEHGTPWQEIRSTAADWRKAGREPLLKMLHHLHLVRAFEESVLELAGEQLVHGPAHSSIGQEGGAVGAMASLGSGDQINGSHRAHHQFLAKALNHVLNDSGYDPLAKNEHEAIAPSLQTTLAEIMGLEQGFTNGRGGSMHLRWADCGVIGTNAIVGGGVPFANGSAWSRKRLGNGEVVVSFLGDGAVHIGSVPESMNLAAAWDLPICFFIENNQVAVSTSVPESTRETRLSARGAAYGIPAFKVDGMDPLAVKIAMDKATQIMRSGQGPTIIEADCYRFFHQNGPLPGSAFGYRTKEDEDAWRARDPIERVANEMVEQKMIKPSDHAMLRQRSQETMRQVVGQLVEPEGNKRRVIPTLWPSTDTSDVGLRGDLSEFAGVRFEEQETFSGKIEEMKFIDVVSAVMDHRMSEDERIFCLGEDIHRLRGGTNGATRGLAAKYPDRILGTPITEGGFAGLAGGVATDGHFRPVVEFMYPDFTLVAADQVFNQIGKFRHMFSNTLTMPLVLRTKVAMGSGYGSQHSMDPSGLFTMFPGWRVVTPSTPFDYVGLMNSALTCDDPVLVIEHIDLYQTDGLGPVDDFSYHIPLGKAKVVREGNRATVLTYLSMVPRCLKVAEEMGLDIEIIDLRSIDRAGLDWETIGASVAKTNNVVVVEQGPLTASYGAMLVDEVQRRLFDHLDQPVQRIHGRHASPTISKALEAAAVTSDDGLRQGFAKLMTEQGLPLASVAE